MAKTQLVYHCRCRQGLVPHIRTQTWTSRRWMCAWAYLWLRERQSCHRINAIYDYLFKKPSDTLAVQNSQEGKGKQRGKKKWENTQETAGENVPISLQWVRTQMCGVTSPTTQKTQCYSNLAICFCWIWDGLCPLIGSLTGLKVSLAKHIPQHSRTCCVLPHGASFTPQSLLLVVRPHINKTLSLWASIEWFKKKLNPS